MQDELINSYMNVLNEGKTEVPSHEVKGTVKPSNKTAFGDFKEGNDADENVSGELETPKKCDYNSDDDTGTKESTQRLDKSSFSNPFDALYSKILGENSFNFSTEEDNELEPSFDMGSENDLDETDDLSDLDNMDDLGDLDDMGEEDEDGEFGGEVDLKEVLGKLKDVLSELEKIVSDDDEEEADDIEDMEDEGEEEGSDESDEDESEEEEEGEEDVVKEESWKEASARKEQRDSRKERLAKKKVKTDKLKKASKYDDDEEDEKNLKLRESVKVKGLKKGVNLKPFSGNIKKLQNKKAEVSENKPKAVKSKAQTPSTGSGFDGMLKKLSPTAGHNLTKASSHTVSGAVKAGKSLFEQ
jgi:hypothetical protein